MDIEMIDRVARELFQHASVGHILNDASWNDLSSASKERWKASAKIAIATMREPTEKMTDALSNSGIMYKDNNSYGIWTTYIDAIIGD